MEIDLQDILSVQEQAFFQDGPETQLLNLHPIRSHRQSRKAVASGFIRFPFKLLICISIDGSYSNARNEGLG
nr:hypothetical protein [Paracidobacterium acidisoli]